MASSRAVARARRIAGRSPRHAALTQQVGLPEYLAEHLRKVAIDHQEGLFERRTDLVAEITGRAARSLREFVGEHRGQFEGREAVLLGV